MTDLERFGILSKHRLFALTHEQKKEFDELKAKLEKLIEDGVKYRELGRQDYVAIERKVWELERKENKDLKKQMQKNQEIVERLVKMIDIEKEHLQFTGGYEGNTCQHACELLNIILYGE